VINDNYNQTYFGNVNSPFIEGCQGWAANPESSVFFKLFRRLYVKIRLKPEGSFLKLA
jgi:hypothetical protein